MRAKHGRRGGRSLALAAISAAAEVEAHEGTMAE